MAEVNLEFLQDLIKDEEPDVIINYFEGAPGSKRGDNYTSMVYRITLKGTRRHTDPDGSNATQEPWESSIIYKCLPESIHLRDAFKSDVLFCNEVAFYNKIWPALTSFQNQWEGLKTPFKSIPKCYLAQSDTVVLKDLKRLGFVMPDRRKGLSIEQAYFVMKHLAHFHSLSLAMKCHNPEDFYELLNVKDGISEVFFVAENEDYYKNYYKEAALNAISMVETELQHHPKKDVYLEKFRRFCCEDTFFQTMVDLVTPKEPLAVICHGDCWTNNFLFRYVDGDIAEMYLVDFQLARYASPALDLAYVTYMCLEKPQRDEHLSSLLEYYADELHKRLMEMGDEDSVFYTSLTRDVMYEMLQEELKRCSRFALGIALDMYPIMMCDSNEAPNLYETKESDSPAHECTKPVWTSNEACRRKMTDLVVELVDAGLL
ncbi:unnamed protein product [Chilo suppressalis]|uniref:CHK kinase-like domain-containing protein n=1 Tax=Chilo suppressalis TaxID=168631 RepID=A0ABN8B105_CHISP|nr:unnamed protein product [Chilo suppressalis]